MMELAIPDGGATVRLPISDLPAAEYNGRSIGAIHNSCLTYCLTADRSYADRPSSYASFAEVAALCAEFLIVRERTSVRLVCRARTVLDQLLRSAGAFALDEQGNLVTRKPTEFSSRFIELISPGLRSPRLVDEIMRLNTMATSGARFSSSQLAQEMEELANQDWNPRERVFVSAAMDMCRHSVTFWAAALSGQDGATEGPDGEVAVADIIGGLGGNVVCDGAGAAFFSVAFSYLEAKQQANEEAGGGTGGGGTGGDVS